MRSSIAFAVVTLLSALSANAFGGLDKIRVRCNDDSLNPTEARSRISTLLDSRMDVARSIAESDTGMVLDDAQTRQYWVTVCLKDPFGNDRARPYYPTWGTSNYENPRSYYFPPATAAHATVSTAIPADYELLGFCESSCFKPEGQLLFASNNNGDSEFKDVAIGDAFNQLLPDVAALSDDSTLENLQLVSRPVDHYTISSSSTTHKILTFTLESGKVLEVTGNHPLVDATGIMREAETFSVGDALVQINGQPDPISSIVPSSWFGKVYNIAPASNSLTGNVIVASGLLVGDSWYMNDGLENMNAKVFRASIPADVLD